MGLRSSNPCVVPGSAVRTPGVPVTTCRRGGGKDEQEGSAGQRSLSPAPCPAHRRGQVLAQRCVSISCWRGDRVGFPFHTEKQRAPLRFLNGDLPRVGILATQRYEDCHSFNEPKPVSWIMSPESVDTVCVRVCV